MIFGKHINRYYLKYAPRLLLGAVALILVDYVQLILPELYRMLVNGLNTGSVLYNGVQVPFTMDFLLDHLCLPIVYIIVVMVIGRFLWRVCFFGAAIKVETDIRIRMFDHCKDLSREYYQVNKVGNLMSLFTNDLDTIQECFGDGLLMFCDALFLGSLAFSKMLRMDLTLTLLTLVPLTMLLLVGVFMGKTMMKKWEVRQQAFSNLSDFAQESFSGFAVVKAFVKELVQLKDFQKLNIDNENTNVSYVKTSTKLHVFITLLVETVICVILGYGGYLVYRHRFDAGQLVEYIAYFSSVVWPAAGGEDRRAGQARGHGHRAGPGQDRVSGSDLPLPRRGVRRPPERVLHHRARGERGHRGQDRLRQDHHRGSDPADLQRA